MEDGTSSVQIPSIENEEQFWEIIHRFQNGILAGIDLFISKPPSSVSTMDIKQSIDQSIKRKNDTFHSGKSFVEIIYSHIEILDNKRFRSNGKSNRKKTSIPVIGMESSSNGLAYPPERYTPSDVAKFVKKIDPSFQNLASRFLQEVFSLMI